MPPFLPSGPAYKEKGIARPRDCAFKEQQIPVRVDRYYLEVSDGDPGVAHVSGHFQSLEHPAGRRASPDGAGRSVAVGLPVGLGASVEVVPLYAACEASALGTARSVHQLSRLEQACVYPLAQFDLGKLIYTELPQVSKQLARRLKMALPGLVESSNWLVAQLHAHIPVILQRLYLGYRARACLNGGDRIGRPVFAEDLRGPDYLAYDSMNRHW